MQPYYGGRDNAAGGSADYAPQQQLDEYFDDADVHDAISDAELFAGGQLREESGAHLVGDVDAALTVEDAPAPQLKLRVNATRAVAAATAATQHRAGDSAPGSPVAEDTAKPTLSPPSFDTWTPPYPALGDRELRAIETFFSLFNQTVNVVDRNSYYSCLSAWAKNQSAAQLQPPMAQHWVS